MFDLGRSFLASVERDPQAEAIIDGATRRTYADWYRRISAVGSGLASLGVRKGDRLVSILQNNEAAATLHWACQFQGIVITPVNWRAKADELDYVLGDSEAEAVVFEPVSAEAVSGSALAGRLPRIAVGGATGQGAVPFEDLATTCASDAMPLADADNLSLMLYTSGTTGKPKGVPRRHRTERAAAIAHVAQNLYRRSERTLGVMPLYHTMGVRSLLAMSLIGGAFICLPRFDAERALSLIEAEHVTNLYLVPTLYHDLLAHPGFASADVSSVRKLGFAGASMTDGLLQALNTAFDPELFVNHYGSSEIYTFAIDQDAPRKPGSSGRAGLNGRLRIVELGATSPDRLAAIGTEGQIAIDAHGDEAFEGYWRRRDADERAFRDGWYFPGDTGFIDVEGDLFVTGRVDDLIITGGENVSPVEVESCLSLHDAVSEVAVVGLPDERWGKIVAAFIRRRMKVTEQDLDAHCRRSGLADFKRPRRYVFVAEIPRSPVGKLLRRKLADGEYDTETAAPMTEQTGDRSV